MLRGTDYKSVQWGCPTKTHSMDIIEYEGSTLYHYIKTEYLFNILQKRQFILRRVDTWMDKYECPFDALRFLIDENTGVESMDYRKCFYGASFTKDEESDAMWRLYSPVMNSVRLEIDVNELKKSIIRLKKIFHWCAQEKRKASSKVQSCPQYPLVESLKKCTFSALKQIENETEFEPLDNIAKESNFALLGEVLYIDDRGMEDWISKLAEIIKDDLSFCGHYTDALLGLLHKREAYQYENEVRALAYWEWPLCDPESLPMSIDPAKLIKSITLDPRLSEEEVRKITSCLATRYGVPCQSIKQSGLYRAPIKRNVILHQNNNISQAIQNKRTLFLGNGFSRALCEKGCSWSTILQADKSKIKNYTLLYEARFVMGEFEGGNNELEVKQGLMDKLPRLNQIKDIYNTDISSFGDKLEKARITDIITTNYDNLLEEILKGCGYSIEDIDTSEKIYSIRRRKKCTNNRTGHVLMLWKMHGSAEDEDKDEASQTYKTITLGLDHYCGHIAKLSNYIKKAYPYPDEPSKCCLSMEEKCKSNKFDGVSWAELFFNSDVYIAGFGMDFSEIDIWWLLTRRARLINKKSEDINNRIHYLYSNCHDSGKDDIFEALKAFGVDCHGICTCANYIDNLFKAIDEIDTSMPISC